MKWYMAFRKKRTWLLLLIPISIFLLWIAKYNPWIAEYVFARGIYKKLSQGLSLITNLFPFSIMELEILVFPIIAVIIVLRFIWKMLYKIRKKQDGKSYMLAGGILNIACIFSVLLFLYVNLAGINYYRYSMATISGLEIQKSSVNDLYSLCMELAENAADIRAQLQNQTGEEDSNGVLDIDKNGWKDVFQTAKDSYEKISKIYPVLGGYNGTPKPVFFSKFMSRMEITGIFWPFTMEANVNTDASEYSVPAAMEHELAHLRGFMREDEANFISYLVCKQSDSLEFQYSGNMLALTYAQNQLYKEDEGLYKKVLEAYNTGMVADVREEYYYWEQFENTVISTVSNTMNDTYLKANSQDDGVKSYGRMVDLLLAEYHKNHAENNIN